MRGMLQLLDELLMQIDLKDKIHLAFKVIINETLHKFLNGTNIIPFSEFLLVIKLLKTNLQYYDHARYLRYKENTVEV